MKIEIYVKNSDLETVETHLKEFNTAMKKGSKNDVYHKSLSSAEYRQILNIYVADTSLTEALKSILELFKKSIDIRIAFKYGSFGNLIFINYHELTEFITKDEESSHKAVEKLYQ